MPDFITLSAGWGEGGENKGERRGGGRREEEREEERGGEEEEKGGRLKGKESEMQNK